MCRQLVEAINELEQADNRIFAEVTINDEPISGLLDTGASVCLREKTAEKLLKS